MKLNKIFAAFMLIMAVAFAACNENPPVGPGNGPNSGNGGDNPFPNYTSRYYINGNYVTAAGSNAANYDWKGVIYDSGIPTVNGERCMEDQNNYYGEGKGYVKIKLTEPIDAGEITTHNAEIAYML